VGGIVAVEVALGDAVTEGAIVGEGVCVWVAVSVGIVVAVCVGVAVAVGRKKAKIPSPCWTDGIKNQAPIKIVPIRIKNISMPNPIRRVGLRD
jgi:hypothetical protein